MPTKSSAPAGEITPSPAALSAPMSHVPPGRLWPLVGVLVLMLALAATLAGERGAKGAPEAQRQPVLSPAENWLLDGGGGRRAAAAYVRWLVIITVLSAAVLLILDRIRP